MTKPDPTLAKLDAELSARMTGTNVNDYLTENRTLIAERRAQWRGKVADFWDILADAFRAGGIVNKYGAPLNGPALRKVWDRMHQRGRNQTIPGLTSSKPDTGPISYAPVFRSVSDPKT